MVQIFNCTGTGPLVGVGTNEGPISYGPWSRTAAFVPSVYLAGLREAGAVPVLLPPGPGLAGVVPLLDAVLLIGGPDIDPSLYGEQPHPLTAPAGGGRDESEIELVRAAIEHDVPTLAICRGLEVLNVTLGGSLTQHLPDVVGHDAHQPDPNAFTRHDVEAIFPGSTERETYSVPSFHHQAINRLAPELEPWAWASDGTVEAARHRTATWVHGVQWHPEVGDDLHIIDTFITAMAQRRTEKLESAR